MWMLPLYLHVNQKSDYDDMMTIYGHGSHLGQRTVTILAIFYSPYLRRLHVKFEQNRPRGSREEVV